MAWWSKRALERPPSAAVVPPPRSEAWAVSPDRAMTLAAIYRAVAIYSTALGQMPIHVERGGQPIESRLAEKPDINTTRVDFLEQTATALALHGECFWWKTLNDMGTTINVAVLPHDRIQVLVQDPNAIVPVPRYMVDDRNVTRYVAHVRLQTKPGQVRGFGPLQAAWPDVVDMLKLRDYAGAYYNVGQPLGVLSTDQVLTPEMAETNRDTWAEKMSQRTVAVLGSGMSYNPLFADAVQAQLTDALRQSNATAARLFGVPPQLLAASLEGSSMTYQNQASLMLAWLQTGLASYITSIESAFTDLLPRGQDARLKMDALLRADLDSRVNAYTGLVALGAMTPEEVRLSEGMSPMPEGEAAPKVGTHPQDETNGSPV